MNKVYVIIYEKKDKSRDYTSLINELQKKGWMHYFESAWLISTDETSVELANRLRNHMDIKDFLIVIEVIKNHYFGWLPAEAWDWINKQ
jgi:hypothetical protein